MLVRHKYGDTIHTILCLARMCPVEWMTDWEWSERAKVHRVDHGMRRNSGPISAPISPTALDDTGSLRLRLT
jgi:hypothetical protein